MAVGLTPPVSLAALACSGAAAADRIAAASHQSWVLFAVAAAVAVVGLVALAARRASRAQIAAVLLTIPLQPAPWLSARTGDCGQVLALASWIGLAVAAALVFVLAVVVPTVRAEREV